MRREQQRRFGPPPPVTCRACGSDAFAVGEARTVGAALALDLRCGACGLWQHRRLLAKAAERFLEHLAETQREIARELAQATRGS